jgi:hypothetical protein
LPLDMTNWLKLFLVLFTWSLLSFGSFDDTP